MSGLWVFGYGSLVSPHSFGHTLGRDLRPGVDFFEAEISGYGRRWNYGTSSMFTAPLAPGLEPREWMFIALGVVAAADETTNGVIGWVNDDELAELDRRERRYDRVDVSALATVDAAVSVDAPIVTYVPRREALIAYEAARQRGQAAITKRYWDLVDGAFADLGVDRHERYRATTPAPDIPIVEMSPEQVPDRHLGRP
jgi:cation transport regulator ChaC